MMMRKSFMGMESRTRGGLLSGTISNSLSTEVIWGTVKEMVYYAQK